MTDAEQNALIDIVRTGAELIRLLKRMIEVYGELPDRIDSIEARLPAALEAQLDDMENRIIALEKRR